MNGFVLTGTREPEAASVHLAAGPISADLVNGNLRAIRYDGVEVLRAVAYIVRDRDWGTYDPILSNLQIEQTDGAFSVSYDAVCDAPDGSSLSFAAKIIGKASTGLSFEAIARPETDFETNRCGFCILHPVVGVAGEPVTVEHVDGSVVETRLPGLIDPWQPFKAMRAITHTVSAGLKAECRMEGDSFEMEDQRNWSDASYKTYVRPLELPWPYVMRPGEAQTQAVTLRFLGRPRATARQQRHAPVKIAAGTVDGPKLPDIGVVIYPQDVPSTLARLDLLEQLAPQALLLHFDRTAGHDTQSLQDFARLVDACPAPATLECVVRGDGDLDGEFAEIAASVAGSGLKLAAIAVSPSADQRSTPPGSAWPDCPPLADVYAAARRAFPDLGLGGGMFSYFTELNRKRVPAEPLDFITHCTCPTVHAADDLSVMQSLEALPFITGSARAIYGGKPYRIGPSTIAMRQNPYGSATKPNPGLSRIAMADRDPRHNGLFGAAWAVGYAARVVPAGLAQLTLGSLAGPFGLVAEEGEPLRQGLPRPLFHVLRHLAGMAGMISIAAESGAEHRVAALAGRGPDGRVACLMANLTAEDVSVDVADDGVVGLRARLLDAVAVADNSGEPRSIDADAGRLVLGPYAVVLSN